MKNSQTQIKRVLTPLPQYSEDKSVLDAVPLDWKLSRSYEFDDGKVLSLLTLNGMTYKIILQKPGYEQEITEHFNDNMLANLRFNRLVDLIR